MRSLVALTLLLTACGESPAGGTTAADGAVATDAAAPSDVVESNDVAVPQGLQLRTHAVNIVDGEAATEVERYVRGESPELYTAAARFYEHFGDDYDFVYIFSDGPVMGATAAARFTPVRRMPMQGTGITRTTNNTRYPAAAQRLKGAIGVNLAAGGNGPTLHETLHYWSMFLDARFGFGRDRDQSFGAHWGVAGIQGQHGGFDPATLRCSTPADASPPGCMPDGDGVTRVTVGTFGPNANGGDSKPYAPLELYLMGLIPRAEVGGPFTVLEGAHYVSTDSATRRMTFEITGTHTVSIDEIVAVHGERAPAPAEQRAFRGAFVVFSAAPVSAARMDLLERWASIFGNDTPHSALLSFERATGGRATLSTRLGTPR
ncbi:MAG: hypothetical protein R3A48_29435 [Polyangiales bacterium]